MRKNKKMPTPVLVILGLIIVGIVLIFALSGKRQHISLQGECGLVMGNLMNKIENEDSCRVQCLNECISIDKDMVKSVFLSGGTTGCNSCDCYCK